MYKINIEKCRKEGLNLIKCLVVGGVALFIGVSLIGLFIWASPHSLAVLLAFFIGLLICGKKGWLK